jgi:hypothetical protein
LIAILGFAMFIRHRIAASGDEKHRNSIYAHSNHIKIKEPYCDALANPQVATLSFDFSIPLIFNVSSLM